jgi:hypothetical protein
MDYTNLSILKLPPTASGQSWSGNSNTSYVARYAYGAVDWYWLDGVPGPDTYYITVRLYFDDGGIIKLEDQKDITAFGRLSCGRKLICVCGRPAQGLLYKPRRGLQ